MTRHHDVSMYFALAIALALLGGTFGNTIRDSTKKTTLKELREALETNDKFWLKKRTYNITGHSCVYAKKLLLENNKYEFEQHYLNNSQTVKHELMAQLSEGQDGAVMNVGQKGGKKGFYLSR
ncbi:hypothetical protein MTO96_043033, partial [Rhipicephalus appendiculatus]